MGPLRRPARVDRVPLLDREHLGDVELGQQRLATGDLVFGRLEQMPAYRGSGPFAREAGMPPRQLGLVWFTTRRWGKVLAAMLLMGAVLKIAVAALRAAAIGVAAFGCFMGQCETVGRPALQ